MTFQLARDIPELFRKVLSDLNESFTKPEVDGDGFNQRFMKASKAKGYYSVLYGDSHAMGCKDVVYKITVMNCLTIHLHAVTNGHATGGPKFDGMNYVHCFHSVVVVSDDVVFNPLFEIPRLDVGLIEAYATLKGIVNWGQ